VSFLQKIDHHISIIKLEYHHHNNIPLTNTKKKQSLKRKFSYFYYQVTNVRVGQDLIEHQHRLEEEEATRKRTERLEQDKKSSSEKFEEVIQIEL